MEQRRSRAYARQTSAGQEGCMAPAGPPKRSREAGGRRVPHDAPEDGSGRTGHAHHAGALHVDQCHLAGRAMYGDSKGSQSGGRGGEADASSATALSRPGRGGGNKCSAGTGAGLPPPHTHKKKKQSTASQPAAARSASRSHPVDGGKALDADVGGSRHQCLIITDHRARGSLHAQSQRAGRGAYQRGGE